MSQMAVCESCGKRFDYGSEEIHTHGSIIEGSSRIEGLERIMNIAPNPYIRPNGEVVAEPLNFKFKVGQRVHNIAFGYNAIVMRRIYTEDQDSHYHAYDLAMWETRPPLEGQCVAEIYLKADFRIE